MTDTEPTTAVGCTVRNWDLPGDGARWDDGPDYGGFWADDDRDEEYPATVPMAGGPSIVVGSRAVRDYVVAAARNNARLDARDHAT